MTLTATDKEVQQAIDELERQINKNRPRVALYARVSTDDKDQNPETQLYALRQFCQDAGWEIYQEYVDKARAKDYRRRTAWQQMQKDARQRKFKCVLVVHLDRAFRSVRECVNCLEDWQERGITFKSVRQGVIDTTTSMGRFVLHVLAAAAELESGLIGERVSAGMRRAKAEGSRIGRKRLGIPSQTICEALQRSSKVVDAAEKLHCSVSYIYKYVSEPTKFLGVKK